MSTSYRYPKQPRHHSSPPSPEREPFEEYGESQRKSHSAGSHYSARRVEFDDEDRLATYAYPPLNIIQENSPTVPVLQQRLDAALNDLKNERMKQSARRTHEQESEINSRLHSSHGLPRSYKSQFAPTFSATDYTSHSRYTEDVPSRSGAALLNELRIESKKIQKITQLFLIFLLRRNGNMYRQKSSIPLTATSTADFDSLFEGFTAKHTQPMSKGAAVPSVDRIGYVLQHGHIYASLPSMDQKSFDYMRWCLTQSGVEHGRFEQQQQQQQQPPPHVVECPVDSHLLDPELVSLLDTVNAMAHTSRDAFDNDGDFASHLIYESQLARNYRQPLVHFKVPRARDTLHYDGTTSNSMCLGTFVTWQQSPATLVDLIIDSCEDVQQLRDTIREKEQLRVQLEQDGFHAADLQKFNLNHFFSETPTLTRSPSGSSSTSSSPPLTTATPRGSQPEQHQRRLEGAMASLDMQLYHDQTLMETRQRQRSVDLSRFGLNQCRNLDFVLGHQMQLTQSLLTRTRQFMSYEYADYREQHCRPGSLNYLSVQEVLARQEFLQHVHEQAKLVAQQLKPKIKSWSDYHGNLTKLYKVRSDS